jgi:hypothetical protein
VSVLSDSVMSDTKVPISFPEKGVWGRRRHCN